MKSEEQGRLAEFVLHSGRIGDEPSHDAGIPVSFFGAPLIQAPDGIRSRFRVYAHSAWAMLIDNHFSSSRLDGDYVVPRSVMPSISVPHANA